jgi:hypothetical protein
MTKIPHLHWAALSGEGDWTTAADWDTGTVPTGDEVAALDKAGTYQVDVNGDVTVEEIKVNAAGATLVESASGHLATRTFFIEDGTAELNAANDIQNIVAEGGALILGNTHALGSANVFATDTALVFSVDGTFHNAWGFGGASRIAATAGHTVNMAGNFGFNDATVTFGGDGDTGTIKIAGSTFSIVSVNPSTIDIVSGTVMGGSNAADLAAGQMVADVSALHIESGATLDVRNFGANVTLNGLMGDGTVLSHGNNMTLTGANFNGTFSGNPVITATGTNSINGTFGHAMITMGAGTDSLSLGEANGKVTISAPSGSNATVLVGLHTPIFFTDFSAGHVTIEVVGARGDHVSYIAGDGFERAVVHLGDGHVDNFYLYGVTSPDQINVGHDASSDMLITYAAAEIAAHQSFVPMPHDGLF